MTFSGIQGRDNAIEYILNKYSKGEYRDFLVIGEKGTGKKYILNRIINELVDYENLSVYKPVGDEFIDCNEYIYTKKISKASIQFNLSTFFGISISTDERSKTKTNYILNILRKIPNNNIAFIISDWNDLTIEIREFVNILIKEKDFFTSQTNKSYFFIISNEQPESMLVKFEYIELAKYLERDVIDYLISTFDFDESKAIRIFNLCGSNLNLVTLLAQELDEKNAIYENTLENLILHKLDECKRKAQEKDIRSEQIEHIIITCAFCLRSFTNEEISHITELNSKIVSDSFHISTNENLFVQENMTYDFLSDEIKNILQTRFNYNSSTYIDYYKYLTQNKPDEYYQRALYIIKYHNTITKNAASLLVLSLLLNHIQLWETNYNNIEKIIYQYNIKYLALFQKIKAFYIAYRNGQGELANESIKGYDKLLLNSVGNAAIERAIFQNNYKCKQKIQVESLYYNLMYYINNPLYILEDNICNNEELLLKLKIIYTLLPYVIDDRNDIDTFNILNEQGNVIYRNLCSMPYEIKGLTYMKNIMNRKAFLFAHPKATSSYYIEAELYFRENEIWDQYCMSLISHAGTLLACGEYQDSISLCKEALKVINEKKILLDAPQKLYNNYYIAIFLNKEKNLSDKALLFKEAETTISKLKKLLTSESNASNHVILTNIASLQLYCDKFDDYLFTKTIIESSLQCEDVSDLNDDSVNDFYRYHFACFELYYLQRNEKWEECVNLIKHISAFVPALFKKFENMLEDKFHFFMKKLSAHISLDGPDFCLWRKTIKSSTFLDRGLLLSDLQFTSND